MNPLINSILGIGYSMNKETADRYKDLCPRAFFDTPRESERIDYIPGQLDEYCSRMIDAIRETLFDNADTSGYTDYHLDKAYQYFDAWEAAGLDVRRAAMIYLLTYTRYFDGQEKPNSSSWVVQNYELFSWALKCIEYEAGLANELPHRHIRVVVTAANRMIMPDGLVLQLVGARHWSSAMHMQWVPIRNRLKEDLSKEDYVALRNSEEQGFIDQWDEFLTRSEAYVVARLAGQINTRRLKSGNPGETILWSEDIH